MRKKKFPIIDDLSDKVNIKISPTVKAIHPVVERLTRELAELDFIKFIRITPENIQASNELSEGRFKIPITKPDHPTAIGVYLIIDISFNDIQFYEITSSVKGCGGKMVEAVMKALLNDWQTVVVMDWSHGFWDNMKKKYKNLQIL
jgi:hypothetical protein